MQSQRQTIEPQKAVDIVEITRLLAHLTPEQVAAIRLRIEWDLLQHPAGISHRYVGRDTLIEEAVELMEDAPFEFVSLWVRTMESQASLGKRLGAREAAEPPASRRRRKRAVEEAAAMAQTG